MSLGNDPRRVPDREPPIYDCRNCDRQHHNPGGLCPDCWHEQRGR